MKKIVMIFAAMAAVLSSCQKNELESVSANDGKDIVLNISVSNPGADDTKALVKTGWVKDDQIKIWFDTNTGADPGLVIKYDGSNWVKVGPNPFMLKADGYIKAVYNNFVIVASKDNYTFNVEKLSFNIQNWKFLTEIQVVVKGLDYDVNEPYTLSCDKFTPLDKTGFKVTEAGIESVVKTKGNSAVGQANADGVAFVFATADYSSTAADFKFTLKNLINEGFGTREYTVNTNKISEVQDHKSIKALTIDISKFPVPAPDGFVDLGVVVNSKPLYWAEKNLGATNPQDYGTYYSWGDVTGQTRLGSSFSPGFSWSNAPFNGGKASYSPTDFNDVKDAACPSGVLAQTYDAAYQTNSAWRMPTKEDFTELAKQCFLEWTENYNNTGVKGVIVWKAKGDDAGWFKPSTAGKGREIKDDGSGYNTAEGHTFSNTYAIGTDPCVFFPSAGWGQGINIDYANYGLYWSSSLYTDTDNAYGLCFNSGDVSPQDNNSRRNGLSVRPVSDK